MVVNNKLLIWLAGVMLGCLSWVSLASASSQDYTLISQSQLDKVTQQSVLRTKVIIDQLASVKTEGYANRIIKTAEHEFADTPYDSRDVTGESNWCPGNIYAHHCVHIQQAPLFRTDQFVCSTYVEQVLALLHANNISQYTRNFLRIHYGAAGLPSTSIHYYNRNNFISSDFNPVNEKHGLLKDGLRSHYFKPYIKFQHTIIDHAGWFAAMQHVARRKSAVQVFSVADAEKVLRYFNGNYPNQYHVFKPQPVTMDYLPKLDLVKLVKHGSAKTHVVNGAMISHLPTPSVLEIVRDDHLWQVNGKSIRDILHSGIVVSHLGLLYRQHFSYHQPIYNKIACRYSWSRQKVCRVIPQCCGRKQGCSEVMFSHATDMYPQGYYYFKDQQGHFHCQSAKPAKGIVDYTRCNRVVSLPLSDYVLMRQYGKNTFLDNPSILGVHIEKIAN